MVSRVVFRVIPWGFHALCCTLSRLGKATVRRVVSSPYHMRRSCIAFYSVWGFRSPFILSRINITTTTLHKFYNWLILRFIWSTQLRELHLLVYLSSLKRFLVLPELFFFVEMQTRFKSKKKYGKNLMWITGPVSKFSFREGDYTDFYHLTWDALQPGGVTDISKEPAASIFRIVE